LGAHLAVDGGVEVTSLALPARPAQAPLETRRIRAVLFDVDGTFYHQPLLRAWMSLELAFLPVTSGSIESSLETLRILRAYRRAHETLRSGVPTGESVARLQTTSTALSAGVSEQRVHAVVDEWMCRRPLKYMLRCRRRDLVPLLTELRRRKVLLGVLSDYPVREKLAALGIGPFFSQLLCTTQPDINALKPSPRGFRRACELWNLSPREVLYVGDRPDVDAPGALSAGLHCAIVGRRRTRDRPPDGPAASVRRLSSIRDFVGGS
jgi:HAD superfamily hydrolase (TIGR01549 family)